MSEINVAVGARAQLLYAPESDWGELIETNDVQTLTITGSPTGGSFKLTFNGVETGSITFDTTEATTAAAIQVALRAMSTINGAFVTCTAPGAQDTYTITFISTMGKQRQPLITFSTNALTAGTAPDGAVVHTTPGTPSWRKLRLMGGASLQPNFAIYQSNEIRDDREQADDMIGTERPDYSLPFELSRSWYPFLWHLIGGAITTTPGPVSEVQTLTITGTPTSGSFKLRFGGQTTASIAYNAAAADVVTALEALTTIGTGGVTATGGALPGTAVVITFAGTLANTNPGLIEVGVESFGGGTSPAVAIDVTTHGIPSGYYKHVIIPNPSYNSIGGLPVGFLLELGYQDINVFLAEKGCRVGNVSLNFGIDAVVGGAISGLAREALAPAAATLKTGSAPTVDTMVPFTGVQIAVLEGSTLKQLPITTSATWSVGNNFYADRGFGVGLNRRQHLKPGRRITGGTISFDFRDSVMISKALNQTDTALKFLCASGSESIEIYHPRVKIMPTTGVYPVPGDDGPIGTSLQWQAKKHVSSGYSTRITIVTTDADLTI
jgi:hypothetical protein